MNLFAKKCIDVILKNEGGFQNMPEDYGNWNKCFNKDCQYQLRYTSERCLSCRKCLIGTNKGIAARWYADKYDIKTLTLREATSVYYFYYWLPQSLSLIINQNNDNLILQMFDFGVNSSIRNANKTLQRLIGAYPDGYIGSETIGKLTAYQGNILEDYKHARKVFYEYVAQKNSNKIFLDIWLHRVNNTKF